MASPLTTAQRRILVAGSLAVGLAFLDETAVVTALRAIERDFDATAAEAQWVMGAYLLALASLMAAAGRLADLYGRRRLFVIGAVVFGAGSLACAAAPGEEPLIAARALQGVGASLLMPLGMANATAALPEGRRGWVVGIVSTGATIFLALGPLIGGTLTELASWRLIFLLNLVPVAGVIAVALRDLPETRAPDAVPLDVGGLGLLVGGLSALTIGLLNFQDWGAGAPGTIGTLGSGLVLLGLFVRAERRSPNPLVDLALLRIPAVSGSLCALFAIQFSILGLTVYLTFYLQHALGYSPAVAGLISLPTVAAAPLLAAWVGAFTDRRGTRLPTVASLALAAVGLATVAAVAHDRRVLVLLPALLAFGIARPIATVAAGAATVGAIPRHARGLASALVTQSRQLGAVLGVAVLGLVLTAVEIERRNRLFKSIDSGFSRASREAVDGILSGGDRGQRLLANLSPGARRRAHGAAASAIVSGFTAAMVVTATVAAGAAVASWFLLRRTETVD